MSITVCLCANTIGYPEGGGHLWVYLNWALGLRGLGCEVVWLEGTEPGTPEPRLLALAEALKEGLGPYGLGDRIAFYSRAGEPLPSRLASAFPDPGEAGEADLLLNLSY